MRAIEFPVSVRYPGGVVCDPLAVDDGADVVRSVAPRPPSLDGAVLAVIDNGFERQAVGLGLGDHLVKKLRERAAISDVIYVYKDAVNVPPRREDWAEICRRATAGLALYGA